ncbi:hypothetical protein BU24DRAFT_406493 [Aaosphaeria arxii CBS 175.79]|uniref:Uncharacterized protein n=1 Tax=Aaosphaeria arxii CBS 175.79 TaxID=1450172 RepID=A0A6A5Y360_9PLEO|nr:uncharacterized protein BU24DRAFT_406493 [Aaosphaeria arxii CBS 175.79]KAF2019878.1 hypothetical protein BU24DRAFT_406493 [Aaosphaeria arxii CBS 175.79]
MHLVQHAVMRPNFHIIRERSIPEDLDTEDDLKEGDVNETNQCGDNFNEEAVDHDLSDKTPFNENDSHSPIALLERSRLGQSLLRKLADDIEAHCPLPVPNKQPLRETTIVQKRYSRFENLPYEIRFIIYSYLGWPESGRIWVPLWYDPNLEIRAQASNVELCQYGRSIEDLLTFECTNRITSRRLFPLTEPEPALLSICTSIREDILRRSLGSITVKAKFELSHRNVLNHNCHNCNGDDMPRPPGGKKLLRLPATVFSYITSIHLDHSVGYPSFIDTAAYDSFPGEQNAFLRGRCLRVVPEHPLYARRVLLKQASTIKFLSVYCPALVTLRLEPYLNMVPFSYQQCTVAEETLNPLTIALEELVSGCRSLRTLEIPRYRDFDPTVGLEPFDPRTSIIIERLDLNVPELEKKQWAKAWIEKILDQLNPVWRPTGVTY